MPSRAGSAGTSAAGLGLAIFSGIGQGRLDCPIRHGCWFSLFLSSGQPCPNGRSVPRFNCRGNYGTCGPSLHRTGRQSQIYSRHRQSGPAYHMWAAQFTNMWSGGSGGIETFRFSISCLQHTVCAGFSGDLKISIGGDVWGYFLFSKLKLILFTGIFQEHNYIIAIRF